MEVWEIVKPLDGVSIIPCSEVFHVKRGVDGEVESFQARIVAGGHKQQYGENYTETIAAGAKMPSI